MPADYPFASVEQGDVAFLETGGVAYRCYVWQRSVRADDASEVENYRGAAVEAAVYTEGPHGQSVLLSRLTVRTPASGEYVDCPRVVPYGTEFHVYWIEYDPDANDGVDPGPEPAGRDLHRSTFDVTASPYAWTHRGSQPMHWYHLYDVHSFDASEDYIVGWATDAAEITVVRVNGSTWVDQEWSATVGSLTIDGRSLAVVADRDSPAAVYGSSTRLYAFSRTWASGTASSAETQIVGATGGDVTAIGLTRQGDGTDGQCFLVWESSDSSGTVRMPSVHHARIRTSSLAAVTSTRTRGLTLESKPWKYASQRSAALFTETAMFFCCAGYINRGAGNDWLQTCHYVLRFEDSGSDYEGRPIPVATLSHGIAHTALHGRFPPPSPLGGTGFTPASTPPDNTKRRNHLPSATPAPSFGPLQKSYTTILPKWTRFDAAEAVAGAELRATRYHHDDPWAYPYDDTDAPLPTEPYASTSIAQLEHVPAGDGLFIGGGTPQVYDGERFVECGFPHRPEIIAVGDLGSGSLTAGLRSYVVAYEWRDGRGQTHRAISDPVSRDNSGGNANTIEIRCCSLSMKDNAALGYDTAPPVIIDVYRTTAGGTIFYPLYRGNAGFSVDLVSVPINDPSVFTITVEDAQADSGISDRSPLPYTFTAGAWTPLLPEKPPAFTATARWQNRVWGVAAEDPASLWYSQEILPE